MTKRIFRGILLTALAAAILVAAFITLSLYGVYEQRMAKELRTEAGLVLHALSREADDVAFFTGFRSDNRVTLVAPSGVVLYDSAADAAALENHADRPEIAAALKNGSGECNRYSVTLSDVTMYYAVKTNEGNVLRVSNTRSSILGLLSRMISMLVLIIAGVAILSLIIASRVSKRVVEPINALDLDSPLENEAYDELSPLLLRMERQRKRIDEQLRELNDRQSELSAITENMREGLILTDAEGVVLSMNAGAAAIFGVDAAEHRGRDILSVSRAAALSNAIDAARAGKRGGELLESGGRVYELFASPVAGSEGIAGIVLLLLDKTEHRAAEQERREFTANVSHELKTPLTSISGYAEIMRDGIAKPEDTRIFASRIYDEANRLITLVNDIIQLSRLDEQKGLGERTSVSLLALARNVSLRLRSAAEDKGVSLSIGGSDAAVCGYAPLLDELCYNLIENAVKYTDGGGSVSVSVSREGERPVLTVSDTGCGIPKEAQSRVFERFYRVDKSHSKAVGGTGLGLSIVKHAAAIHGAELSLISEPAKGTTIRVVFP